MYMFFLVFINIIKNIKFKLKKICLSDVSYSDKKINIRFLIFGSFTNFTWFFLCFLNISKNGRILLLHRGLQLYIIILFTVSVFLLYMVKRVGFITHKL